MCQSDCEGHKPGIKNRDAGSQCLRNALFCKLWSPVESNMLNLVSKQCATFCHCCGSFLMEFCDRDITERSIVKSGNICVSCCLLVKLFWSGKTGKSFRVLFCTCGFPSSPWIFSILKTSLKFTNWRIGNYSGNGYLMEENPVQNPNLPGKYPLSKNSRIKAAYIF